MSNNEEKYVVWTKWRVFSTNTDCIYQNLAIYRQVEKNTSYWRNTNETLLAESDTNYVRKYQEENSRYDESKI